MKRIILLFIFVLVSMIFTGCEAARQILGNYVQVGVQTNLPVHANRVVITCPMKLGREKISRIEFSIESRFIGVVVVGNDAPRYLNRFNMKPGMRVVAYSGGTFGDDMMVFTGFIYNKNNELVGRASGSVDFSNSDSFKSNIKVWNITESDIRWTEGSWW